jgi:outer membrane protein TolC
MSIILSRHSQLAIAIIVLSLFAVNSIRATTLEEVVESALQNSEQLSALRAGVEGAVWKQRAIARADLPLLTADAGWRHQTEVPQVEMAMDDIPPPIGPLQLSFPLGVSDNYDTGLQASWLAFSGFAKSAQKQIGRLQIEQQREQLEIATQEIALHTVQLYRTSQLLSLQAAVLESGRDRVRNNIRRLRNLVVNNLVTPLDTLALVLVINDYDRQYLQLYGKMVAAQNALNLLAGVTVEVESYSEDSSINLIHPLLYTEDNPRLTQHEHEILILKQQLRQLNSSCYPRVNLFAGWRWGRPGLNQTRDEWMNYGIVGAQASWILWDGGIRHRLSKSIEAAETAQKEQLTGATRKLQTEYDNALVLYHTEEEQLELLEENLSLTQQQLDGLEVRLQQGDISGSDLRDHLLELTRVETEVVIVRLQLALRRTEIEKLSGLAPAEWSLQ